MRKTLITLGIILLIVVIIYSWFKGAYNGLVSKDQDTKTKWAMVESQYQRRMDLYSNVVSTIKGSAEFEKSTLEAVIKARASATQVTVDPTKLTPESINQFQQAQNNLSSSFGRLLVTMEKYPDLQTTAAFHDFQTQIEGTENRINKARDDFNKSVQEYNTSIKSFPAMLYAKSLGFSERGYFQAAPGSEKAPEVKF